MRKKWLFIGLLIAVPLFGGVGFLTSLNLDSSKTDETGLEGYIEPADEHTISPRENMIYNFRYYERLHVITGGQDPQTSSAYLDQAEQLRWVRYTDHVSTFAYSNSKRFQNGQMEWPDSTAIILVGTPRDHPMIKDLLKRHDAFTFSTNSNSIGVKGQTYTGDSYTLVAMLPNPANPDWPVFLITGTSADAITAQMPRRGMLFDYQLLEDGERIRMGNLTYGKRQVSIDKASDRSRDEDIINVQNSQHFALYVQKELAGTVQPDSLLNELEERLQNVRSFTSTEDYNLPEISYYLYSSFEDQALFSNRMEFSAVDYNTNQVHTVREYEFKGNELAGEIRLVLRSLLGKPAHPLLETGLYMQFIDLWHGSDWREMAARIARTNKDLSLTTLLDSSFWQQQSPLWRQPLAGALVSFLIDTNGKEAFLKAYKNNSLPNPSTLEKNWKTWLQAFTEAHPLKQKFTDTKLPEFLKGFNFSHEGYQVINGYGSREATKSLRELADLGVNTVALNPFGFSREAKKPAPIRFSNRIGSENDASIVHALFAAREFGFTILMKPHIWIRGSWPGDIEMSTEAEWQQFFNHYEQWIRHYAILSQLYESEIFSMGLEMANVTTTHEQEFIDMAERLKKLYDGNLTYAANWYGEFDQLSFWDTFDLIGIDSYYPLSKDSTTTYADLIEGAEDAAWNIQKVSQKFDKPVLVTEIGFTSTKSPWINPHEYGRNSKPYHKDQYLSYNAIRAAWQEEPWLKGIYWWKWPTEPERAAHRHSGFTPRHKPAVKIIERWFSE